MAIVIESEGKKETLPTRVSSIDLLVARHIGQVKIPARLIAAGTLRASSRGSCLAVGAIYALRPR